MAYSPSIFIGIGGVGKNVLLNIRRMIVEEFNDLSLLPSIAFLHVDTDASKQPDAGSDAVTSILGYDLTFSDKERVDLSKGVGNEINAGVDSIKNNPKIKQWFDPSLRLDINFREGAGGIRPYGRLAFQYSVNDFRDKLDATIQRVLQSQNQTKTADCLATDRSDGKLTIYIVCSLLGGTGSGSFLEVCYNVRKVLSQRGSAAQLIGLFVIAGNVDERRKANSYSALKELQYYCMPDGSFSSDYPMPNVGPIVADPSSPVDTCYLISSFAEGYDLQRGELEESAALNLFLEFSSSISEEKRSRRVDITAVQAFNTPDPKTNKPRCFLTFGISSLSFPVFKIQDMMAYELASVALKSWLFEHRETRGDIDDIKRSLDRNLLSKTLLNPDNQNLWLETQNVIRDMKQNAMQTPEPELISAIKGNFDIYQKAFRFSRDPREWGELTRKIQIKGINQLSTTVQFIKDKVVALEQDEFKGPNEARAFLNSLNSYINGVIAESKRQYDMKLKDIETRQKEFGTALNYLQLTIGKNEKFALNHWIKKAYESLQNYALSALHAESHRVIKGMLEEGLINDNGKKQNALRDEIQSLAMDLESYKNNLKRLSDEQMRKKEDIEKTIVGFRSCRDLRIDIIKLRDIAKSIVNDPSALSVTLLNDTLDALSQKDPYGVITQRAQIRWQVNKNEINLINALLFKCKEKCNEIKRHSIAKLLLERKEIIGDYLKMSLPMLKTANHGPGENLYVETLASSPPDENPEVNNIINYIFTIKDYHGMHKRYLKHLPDHYRILFASEKGIFPLRRISVLIEYRRDYMRVRPASTDIRIDFQDIFEEEGTIPKRASEAVLLAKIFGYLIEQPDPVSEYNHLYLKYHDERIRDTRSVKLSENWDTLEPYLTQKQNEKEVLQLDASETPLETLEKLIEKKGKTPRTKKDKESLGSELSNYLEKLKNALEGRESNPEYIRQLNIIEAFRNKFGIPIVIAEVTKSENHNDSKGNSEKTITTKEPRPPDPELVKKFNKDLIDLIQNRGVQDRETLIKRGLIRWGVPRLTAEQLVDDALKVINRDTLFKQYEEIVKSCVIGGAISDEDRGFLDERQKELGLTQEEAKAIEAKFLSPNREDKLNAYRECAASCFVAGEINAEDRAFLIEKQKELGLTDDEAKRIEEEALHG